MIRSMRKHRKKWLAIIGVILMVAFLIPTAGQFAGPKNRVAYRYGPDASQKIYTDDIQQAEAEWELLNSRRMGIEQSMGQTKYLVPLARAFLGDLAQDLRSSDYLLLLKEAETLGAKPSRDEIQRLSEVKIADGQTFYPLPIDEELSDPRARAAIHLLTIMAAYDRVASSVRISQPAALREVVDNSSKLSTILVKFDAEDLATTRPAASTQPTPPTPEETRQFNQFKDVEAGKAADPAKNPFGFGYKYPDRAKLQYIEIAREDVVRNVVVPDIAMRRWFREHATEYPPVEVPAATRPSTQSRLAGPRPSTGPEASTQPTTRPATYDDVKERIRGQLAGALADLIIRGLQRDLTSRMADDFSAWQNNKPSSVKDTAGQPVAYDDPMYMKWLANDIEQKWQQKYPQLYREQFSPTEQEMKSLRPLRLTLRYVDSDVWQTRKTLGELGKRSFEIFASEGIGSAVEQRPSAGRQVPASLTDLVMGRLETFLTDKQKERLKSQGATLQVWQPGPLLISRSAFYGGATEPPSIYLFRVTAAQAAHAPATIDEVLPQVRQDLATAAAYAAAKDKAEQFLKLARAKGGVQTAANELSLPGSRVIETGLFSKTDAKPTTRAISDETAPRFHQEAARLIADLKPDQKHPIRLLELPVQRTLMVAELNQFEPTQRDENLVRQVSGLRQAEKQMAVGFDPYGYGIPGPIMRQWFSSAAIRQRMNLLDPDGKPLPDRGETPVAIEE